MFGEMLRPPEIQVPQITASYCKFVLDERQHYVDPKQRHEVRDDAVQQAVWRGPDGSLGCVFVNVSEEAVEFEVTLSDYGWDRAAYDVDRVTNGESEEWLRGVALPRGERLELGALTVVLLRVRPHEGSKHRSDTG